MIAQPDVIVADITTLDLDAGLIGLPGSRAEHEKALVAGEVPQGVDRVAVEEARRAMREVLAEFVECA